jgi:hypothetical protein
MLGLRGVEMVCIDYNSAAYDPNYMNATCGVAVAKAGNEDGSGLIGGSCIVDPSGPNFAAHRRPAPYTLITESTGAVLPAVT